ncbi:MAG TPA: alpha/beta hydrolase [Longimicrobiaceae bacterium]|nr:alpha/beta hydrolase [Longimicrobiaceae bacterium]
MRNYDARSNMEIGEAAATWAGSRWVMVGDNRVRYREAGDGPAVVLVHGLGVSADYWFRNGPPLAAAGLRVLAPDLPGFGQTPGPSDGLTVEEQARALLEWGDALGLGPAVYVGHSLSCQTVLHLAAEYPERVRALILAAPTGMDGPHRRWHQAWGLFLDAWREPWALFPLVAAAYLRAGPYRYWKTWRAGAEDSLLPLLPQIRVPALVIVGTRDPVVREADARKLAGALPMGKLAMVPGAAHAVIFDRSGEFNELVITTSAEVRKCGSAD